jgi:hypothetical protein
MRGHTYSLRTSIHCLTLVFAAIAWVLTGALDARTSFSVGDLRIKNEIAGWSVHERYRLFDPAGLVELIGGAAQAYAERGLVIGLYQKIRGSGETTAELFAQDFGNEKNATAMLAHRQEYTFSPLPFPKVEGVEAVADLTFDGCVVYARMDRFYFELVFSGFDNVFTALVIARSFVATYASKVPSMKAATQ